MERLYKGIKVLIRDFGDIVKWRTAPQTLPKIAIINTLRELNKVHLKKKHCKHLNVH